MNLKRVTSNLKLERNALGFTLIEVLVVTAITVTIAGFLIANFSRTRVNLNQAALAIQDTIREAQSSALSGVLFQGAYRCGYGVHFLETGFLVYAGPDSSTSTCAGENPNYESGTDVIVRQEPLPDQVLEIVLPASDIFFMPPDPTTFINGSSAPGTSATLLVRRKGEPCPGPDCRSILVTTSGRIELQQ